MSMYDGIRDERKPGLNWRVDTLTTDVSLTSNGTITSTGLITANGGISTSGTTYTGTLFAQNLTPSDTPTVTLNSKVGTVRIVGPVGDFINGTQLVIQINNTQAGSRGIVSLQAATQASDAAFPPAIEIDNVIWNVGANIQIALGNHRNEATGPLVVGKDAASGAYELSFISFD
jgi:hypothetical protein